MVEYGGQRYVLGHKLWGKTGVTKSHVLGHVFLSCSEHVLNNIYDVGLTQCHKPPMTGNGSYHQGDFRGMVSDSFTHIRVDLFPLDV